MSGSRGKQDGPSPAAVQTGSPLSERLTELRKSLGLSQEDFGERLSVSKNTMWNYERGGKVPHDVLVAICTAFDVDARWLLLGVGTAKAHRDTALDLGLMEEVVRGAETVLANERLSLPPDRKAQLLITLYELVRDEQRRDANAKIDLSRFSNVIRLTK